MNERGHVRLGSRWWRLGWIPLILLSLSFAEGRPDALPIHYRSSRTVAVWLPYWLDKDGTGAGWQAVEAHSNLIDEVSFFAFAADPDTGDLTPEGAGHGMGATTMIAQAGWLHTRDIAALMTVTQFDHVGDMLSQPARLNHLIQSIVAATDLYGFDGVDIDFEDFKPGDPGDAERYTQFLTDLSNAMHAHVDSFGFPRMVVATVLAKTERGKFAFTDYAAIANSPVDRVRVMAYDDFYSGSKSAGANAPAPWVASVAAYIASLDAPQWKFSLGMPGYGYQWPVTNGGDWTTTGKGSSVTFAKAQSLMSTKSALRKWQPDQRAPYFSYQDSGKTYVAFYEDAESWDTKVQSILLPSRMNGIADWAISFEDPKSWPVLGADLATDFPITGAVGSCYWRFGGGARFGAPLAKEQDSGGPDNSTLNYRRGREQDFSWGRIYYRWGEPRAYCVTGACLQQYLASGGPSGQYGFPTGDPILAPDGAQTTTFEHGAIAAKD